MVAAHQSDSPTRTTPGNPRQNRIAHSLRHPLFTSVLLLVLIGGIYAQTRGFDFIAHYDDEDYVTANPAVLAGLTWEGVRWSFQTVTASNWHPLTWLSHMLDVQLFGPGAAGPHLVNVFLHFVNTLLLYFLLRRLTGAHWRSAIVAAFFAAHPLQVESVAWISERKDVLSTCFGLLTLWAYARHVLRSKPAIAKAGEGNITQPSSWSRDYGLAVLFFACGLMSKPVLVTLPFVMLLLDWWPLRRFEQRAPNASRSTIHDLVREKLPFLLLSGISSVITIFAQSKGGAVMPLDHLPMTERSANAVVACVRYLGKIFWPVDLAVFYPHPGKWPLAAIAISTFVVVAISVLAVRLGRRFPFGLTGWFWFLGMLIPVIGLVQVGSQSMADRYTYLPKVGILIVMVWGTAELLAHWRPERWAVGLTAVITGLALSVCYLRAADQARVWRNAETLFRHALAVTPDNPIAHNNLGTLRISAGRFDEAIEHFRAAIRIKPNYVDALGNLGAALAQAGKTDEALAIMRQTLALKPDDAMAHYNLGNVLATQGRLAEARAEFQTALRLKPDDAEARGNLAGTMLKQGRPDEAMEEYRRVLLAHPQYVPALENLGQLLFDRGQLVEAIGCFETVVRLQPGKPAYHLRLGRALMRAGNQERALSHLRTAATGLPDSLEAQSEAGIALTQLGKLDEAARRFESALRIAPADLAVQNNLAKVLAMQGRYEDSWRYASEVLRHQPGNTLARNTRGYILAQQGKLEAAMHEYAETLQADPDNFTAHYNLGDLASRLGQRDKARTHLEAALRLKPGSEEAQTGLNSLAEIPPD